MNWLRNLFRVRWAVQDGRWWYVGCDYWVLDPTEATLFPSARLAREARDRVVKDWPGAVVVPC